MCPMCMTTAALIAAGATSAGGLALVAARKLLPARAGKRGPSSTERQGERDATPPDRLAR